MTQTQQTQAQTPNDLFAKANEVLETLHRKLNFIGGSYPRQVWCKGYPMQSVTAIHTHNWQQPDGSTKRETNTLHVTQWWPDEPAVITAVSETWDAEAEKHCYKRISIRDFMGTPSQRTANERLDALKDYFKSLPRPEEYGSAEDVRFVDWEDADPELVEKTLERFDEI